MEKKSRVTEAIQTLVTVFHEYASKDCTEGKGGCEKACLDQFKLSKRELKELLHQELDMDHVNDPKKLDEAMKDLDADGDGQVDFEEFVIFVATMACTCNSFLEMLLNDEECCDE